MKAAKVVRPGTVCTANPQNLLQLLKVRQSVTKFKDHCAFVSENYAVIKDAVEKTVRG